MTDFGLTMQQQLLNQARHAQLNTGQQQTQALSQMDSAQQGRWFKMLYLVSDATRRVYLFSTEAKAMEFIKARWLNEALSIDERKVSLHSIAVDPE